MAAPTQPHSEGSNGDSSIPRTERNAKIRLRLISLSKSKPLIWLIGTALLLIGLYYFAVRYIELKRFSRFEDFLFWTYLIALSGFIYLAVSRIYRTYQRRAEGSINSELESMQSDSLAIKSLVQSLRRRAKTLRNAARFTLFLTFISIASGLYIFTAAGQIASRDIETVALAERLHHSASEPLDSLSRVEDLLRAYESRQLAAGGLLSSQAVDAITSATREINERSKRNEQIITRIEQATSSRDTLFFFLATLSTRIGSVLLLIFLVQILLSVYRYSIRLETYYDSRADALLIYSGSSEEQLQQLISALSPDRIDFGKTPVSPTEHAVEVVKGIASIRK